MRERFEANGASGLKAHEVERQSEQLIGEGSFARVYSVVALVGRGDERRPVRLVEKRYAESPHPTIAANAQANAERAVDNYARLKAAGVKVFATFRLSPDHKTILMTNAKSADWECVSTNKPLDDVEQPAKLDVITNLEELQESIFGDIQKMTEAGLRADRDGVFFLVNRKQPGQIDYVFQDCDAAGELEVEHRKRSGVLDGKVGPLFAKHNLMAGRWAIENFLKHNVQNSEPLVARVKQIYEGHVRALPELKF